MRFGLFLLAGLLLTGCRTFRGKEAGRIEESTWSRLVRRMNPVTPDDLALHYIMVERELNDPDINELLWAQADENSLPMEKLAELRDNGIRVAKLGTRLSEATIEILQKANSQGQGTHIRSKAGVLNRIQATEDLPHWSLFTFQQGQARGQEIDDGQGFLNLLPNISGETTVKLTITPVIEYGPRVNKRVPSRDYTGFQVRNERESRSFEDIGLTIEAESGDYVLIGCHPDRKGTIGHYFFTKQVGGKTMQNAVLIRLMRPSRDELLKSGYDPDFFAGTATSTSSKAPSTARAAMNSEKRPAKPKRSLLPSSRLFTGLAN